MPIEKRYFMDLMKDRGLSLRETAKRVEMWPAALSRSLDGKRTLRMEEAVGLAKVLSVPLAEVLVNAGIEQAVTAGRRCSIIGHVQADSVVIPVAPDVIERIAIPDGLDEDVAAVQFHTSETAAGYCDGWVVFLSPEMEAGDCLGMYCLVHIEADGWMLGTIRRGYSLGTYNVFPPNGEAKKNVRLVRARRALITQH